MAGISLKTGDRILGFLVLENPSPELQRDLSVLRGQISLQMNRIKLYEKIQELAITDGLTGLYVRRQFDARLSEDMARVSRYGGKLSIFLADIDHFKRVNDTWKRGRWFQNNLTISGSSDRLSLQCQDNQDLIRRAHYITLWAGESTE